MDYVVAWRSRITKQEGAGTYLFGTEEECRTVCEVADRDFPDIEHYPRPKTDDTNELRHQEEDNVP